MYPLVHTYFCRIISYSLILSCPKLFSLELLLRSPGLTPLDESRWTNSTSSTYTFPSTIGFIDLFWSFALFYLFIIIFVFYTYLSSNICRTECLTSGPVDLSQRNGVFGNLFIECFRSSITGIYLS